MSKLKKFFLVSDVTTTKSSAKSRTLNQLKELFVTNFDNYEANLSKATATIQSIEQSGLITPGFKKKKIFLVLGRRSESLYKNDVVKFEAFTRAFVAIGMGVFLLSYGYVFLRVITSVFTLPDANIPVRFGCLLLSVGGLFIAIGAWNRLIFLLLSLRKRHV